MSAKFDEESHSDWVFIVFTSLFPHNIMSIVTLTFDSWPPNSRELIISPLLTCLKHLWSGSTQQLSLYCVHKLISICPLWPWPLTSKINRVYPLIMVNMSSKFDEEAHSGLVSIVFTRSNCDTHMNRGRTEARRNHRSVTISPPLCFAWG